MDKSRFFITYKESDKLESEFLSNPVIMHYFFFRYKEQLFTGACGWFGGELYLGSEDSFLKLLKLESLKQFSEYEILLNEVREKLKDLL